ncbi:hypothetical protein PVAG01_10803 [Phlyctema vagabunda]|uniref:Uncharacterized protein n=1 Tax=Phlyctema vagabunda TaxID=108571 RepID=A0ABR4P3B2_9HELO
MEDKSGLCFIWPKDKSTRRGFFRGLGDILSNKGPDIFIDRDRQKKKEHIAVAHWSNWDAYHSRTCHAIETDLKNSFLGAKSRGFERYDPRSRRYTIWMPKEDWDGVGPDPSLTKKDSKKVKRIWLSRGQITPKLMSPERLRREYHDFWQSAHRLGPGQAVFHDAAPHQRFYQTQPTAGFFPSAFPCGYPMHGQGHHG